MPIRKSFFSVMVVAFGLSACGPSYGQYRPQSLPWDGYCDPGDQLNFIEPALKAEGPLPQRHRNQMSVIKEDVELCFSVSKTGDVISLSVRSRNDDLSRTTKTLATRILLQWKFPIQHSEGKPVVVHGIGAIIPLDYPALPLDCDQEQAQFRFPDEEGLALARAVDRDYSGDHALLCFSIDKNGYVLLDSVKPLQPFDDPVDKYLSMNALKSWRFQPRVDKGERVAQHHVLSAVSLERDEYCGKKMLKPIVHVPPVYPNHHHRVFKGWVELMFRVDAQGNVDQETIQVTAAEPSSIFNRAAIRAVRKWKYMPKTVNGQAVSRECVTARLTFKLGDD